MINEVADARNISGSDSSSEPNGKPLTAAAVDSEKSLATSPLRVAIIGAGPAGIYAASILTKSHIEVDIFEQLPAPFGLVRYGVAPDHPRIKEIIAALHKIMDQHLVRLFSNVDYGKDISLAELEQFYDAIIFATGTIKDAPYKLPGVDLPGSFGAADFVAWYDGHPDFPRDWPLDAEQVAVIGAGNVALDIARILAKSADQMHTTEIADNVYEGLAKSPVKDVHVFARRGPAQAKFSPLELRELGQIAGVDIEVFPEDFDFDDYSLAEIEGSSQVKQVVKTLTNWTLNDPADFTGKRRIHLHFFSNPVGILGTDHVTGIRTERTELAGDGTVRGTGNFTDWSVQAVYRAVGYFGSPLPDVPFDSVHGVIPNRAGRVVDPAKSNADAVSNADARNDNAEIAGPARNSGSEQPRENAGEIGGQVRNDDGNGSSGQAAVPSTDVYAAEGTAFDDDDFVVPKPASVRTGGGQSKLETRDDAGAQVPRLYTTGWIKRGPVGLIGSTKSDAAETVANLLADFASERPAPNRDPEAVVNLLRERAVQYLSWDDFVRLDNYEISLGKAAGRNRVKVVPRDEMISISQGK